MKKRLFSLLMTLVLTCVTVVLSMFTVGADTIVTCPDYPDYTFAVDIVDDTGNETYSVNSYSGEDPNPVIPTSANGHKVLRLGVKSFYNNSVVESITMHDDMTSIKRWAARSCDNLEYVYFSKSLVVIYDYAFCYNPSMTTALLRNTQVNEIAEGAFLADTVLEYLSLPDTLRTIGNKVFYNTTMPTIILPDGVTRIGSYAFAYSSDLQSVYIPASVTSMSSNMFENSDNVTVYCIADSTAAQYCEENEVNYVTITEDEYPSNALGDVNNDGNVDICDATAMQKKIAEISNVTFLSQNCDTNADCEFNARDVTHLQKYIANIITEM